MKAHSHDPVRQVERLLHPVSMVDINVYVEHPRMVLQQFQDCYHNVIYVAETWKNLNSFRW